MPALLKDSLRPVAIARTVMTRQDAIHIVRKSKRVPFRTSKMIGMKSLREPDCCPSTMRRTRGATKNHCTLLIGLFKNLEYLLFSLKWNPSFGHAIGAIAAQPNAQLIAEVC